MSTITTKDKATRSLIRGVKTFLAVFVVELIASPAFTAGMQEGDLGAIVASLSVPLGAAVLMFLNKAWRLRETG